MVRPDFARDHRRMPEIPKVDIADNVPESRYEIFVGGELAGYARYRLEDERIVLFDTQVDPAHRGEGLGGQLAGAVLEDIQADGRLVEPQCEFIASYIRRHPEHHELVAPTTSSDRTAA
jgi:uncharacterized protein